MEQICDSELGEVCPNYDSQLTKKPFTSWDFLLQQRLDFLDIQQASVPKVPNQQGTMELQGEALSHVGAKEINLGGYQVSDVKGIEFHWEEPDLDIHQFFDQA